MQAAPYEKPRRVQFRLLPKKFQNQISTINPGLLLRWTLNHQGASYLQQNFQWFRAKSGLVCLKFVFLLGGFLMGHVAARRRPRRSSSGRRRPPRRSNGWLRLRGRWVGPICKRTRSLLCSLFLRVETRDFALNFSCFGFFSPVFYFFVHTQSPKWCRSHALILHKLYSICEAGSELMINAYLVQCRVLLLLFFWT